jgi:hypothetical protein
MAPFSRLARLTGGDWEMQAVDGRLRAGFPASGRQSKARRGSRSGVRLLSVISSLPRQHRDGG